MAVQCKNLAFFVDFINARGYKYSEVAERMNCTVQNLYQHLKADTMKLSVIEKFIESEGYSIKVNLEKAPGMRGRAWVDIETAVPTAESTKRLSFLESTLKRYGISKKDLAEKLEYSYTGVLRIFNVDDISFDTLFKIAESYDLEPTIKIRPIEK